MRILIALCAVAVLVAGCTPASPNADPNAMDGGRVNGATTEDAGGDGTPIPDAS